MDEGSLMPAKDEVVAEETGYSEVVKAAEEAPNPAPTTDVLTKIMEAMTGISESVEHLSESIEDQQNQINSLRDNPAAPKLATYTPPDVSKLKAGEMSERRDVLVPRFMPQPKFRDGDYVQLVEGTEMEKRFAKSGKPQAKGFVFDVPKGLTKAAQWKYSVKFPGIGKGGVIESDLECAA